ncbi:MAG: two-component hybrid sensor and regulator [Ignavibacteria bacterium]|nr:two-component hybrid sensor and regulator [Ignavibacteria bacterium]
MKKPFIMVVDDNRITTKLLRRYLEASGYEAREAYDGIDCLEKVEEQVPDAIVLDVMMPRLDGYETVKRLKSQPKTKDVPVVIVTALNDVANQLKSIDAGADDFLSKPIEEKLLTAKVKMLSGVHLQRKRNDALTELLKRALKGELAGKTFDELIEEIEN